MKASRTRQRPPLSARLPRVLYRGVVLSSLAAACSGAAHPQRASRSRETCEQLLAHSFELEYRAATLALDDHRYQRRKIEAALEKKRQQVRESPTFLKSCNDLSDREFACMSGAGDWYTYQRCYEAPPTGAGTTVAEDRATTTAPATDDAPCPALENPGTGTATVRGRVRDKPTGQPAVGVMVALLQTGVDGQTTFTDESGSYTFEGVLPARYDVVLVGEHLPIKQRCAPIRGGGSYTFDLEIEPPPSEIIELR